MPSAAKNVPCIHLVKTKINSHTYNKAVQMFMSLLKEEVPLHTVTSAQTPAEQLCTVNHPKRFPDLSV